MALVSRADRVRPGDEFRPVGRRQAQQLADDRERQRSRVALDDVGRAAVREQLAGETVGDGANARLHVEHRAAAERLVDDAAQARVVRLVHGQHVVGERRERAAASTSAARQASPPSLRSVKVSLSFSTRAVSS